MKKNKEFTLEQYKINVEKSLAKKAKKLFKKLKEIIYVYGKDQIVLGYEENEIVNKNEMIKLLNLTFPFLDIKKDYCSKIIYIDVKQSKNEGKSFELEQKNQKLEMKILGLESKLEGIKNYAKHIGEISYQQYDKDNLAIEKDSYYLRDDIEITESLYSDLADLYCYLGMNDMIKGEHKHVD